MSAYRQNPLANLPPVTKNLLIINILCFLPYIFFSESFYQNTFIGHLGVFYFASPLFKIWQPITYMFFHGGWMHIFFNMFALYSLGMIVEYTLGSKRFFNFYFICGLGAIALQMIVQAFEVHAITGSIMPDLEHLQLTGAASQKLQEIYAAPMVGASGAIFGIFIAFGVLFPNMELMIMFIPIPVKAKYVMPVYVLIELFLGVEQFQGDAVAHFAHLGGALIGFILIKFWGIRRPNNFF